MNTIIGVSGYLVVMCIVFWIIKGFVKAIRGIKGFTNEEIQESIHEEALLIKYYDDIYQRTPFEDIDKYSRVLYGPGIAWRIDDKFAGPIMNYEKWCELKGV